MTINDWLGGGIPYGYFYNRDTEKLEINKNENKILQRIFRLASQNFGTPKIAGELNENGLATRRGGLWTSSTIGYILHPTRLQFYLGIRDGKKGNWEPVLSEEMFEKLPIRERATQPNKNMENREEFLLSGGNISILFCGHCGGNIKASVTTKKDRNNEPSKNLYYLCTRRQTQGRAQCLNSRLHRQDTINDLVVGDLKMQLNREKQIKSYVNQLRNNIEAEINERVSQAFTGLAFGKNIKPGDFLLWAEQAEKMQKEIMDLKYYFTDEIFPYVTPMKTFKNIKTAILRNIEKAYLYSDRLEIFYKFPVNERLEFRKIFELK